MRKLALALFLIVTPSLGFATDGPIEAMRRKLFPQSLETAACLTFPKNLKEDAKSIDPKLAEFLNSLNVNIKNNDSESLLTLFHPRLGMKRGTAKELLASQRATLGAPLESSTLMLWALNTVDGTPTPLACGGVENSNITVWPQFGYNLQFGVWLQLMGQKELGRIFLTIVPKDGQWYIAALHYQQWTHSGKTYEHWYQAAQQDLAENFKPAAFLKLDIASKLIDGRDEFRLGVFDQLIEFQNSVMSKTDFDKEIRNALTGWNIVYVSSILAKDGAGLAVRVELPKEISTMAMKDDCGKIGRTLQKQPWFAKIDGIKCSYIIKGEDQSRDGRLGGFYLRANEIK